MHYRPRTAGLALALTAALTLSDQGALPTLAAEAGESPQAGQPMSEEELQEFRRLQQEIAKRTGERLARFAARRLAVFERDRIHVEREVERRVQRGETRDDALANVVGVGREERISKAYLRLTQSVVIRPEDRDALRRNFTAVRAAIAGAGFSAGHPYLAVPLVESLYDPKAYNVDPATRETVKGMWQFTESTARDYDLAVTALSASATEDPDERYDPFSSSKAAKKHLDFLEDYRFANGCPSTIELVLASYHLGQGNANKKIEKYGCDFWAWRKDDQDGFGTASYNYPALVLAGPRLLNELEIAL